MDLTAEMWTDLAQYISLGSLRKDDPVRFFIRRPSSDEARKESIIRVARALAHSIERRVDEKLKLVPKPDASAEEFRTAGIVEGALFSTEFVERVVAHAQGSAAQDRPDVSFYLDSKGWELYGMRHRDTFIHAALILNGLATPENAAQHFSSLIYLAQRPRGLLSVAFGFGELVSKDPDGGIMRYVQLTIRQYIFMNLLLALGGPGIFEYDAARKMECFPVGDGDVCPILHYFDDELPGFLDDVDEEKVWRDGGHWFSPLGDPLHNPFWNLRITQDERLETYEGARNSYLTRCFDVIAAFFAVYREMWETNTQTEPGCSFDSEHEELLSSIITAFHSFDDAFLFSYQIDDYPQLAQSNGDYPNEPIPTRPPSNTMAKPSLFLELPPEVIFHIHAFLPFSSLFSLSKVCRRLKELCMESVYANGLSLTVPPVFSTEPHPNREHLCTLLESRGDLRRFIRYVPLFYQHQMADGDVPPFTTFNTEFWHEGIPLFHPLASLLPNVRKVKLRLECPHAWSSDTERIVHAALSTLHERSHRGIQSLDLGVHMITLQPTDGLLPSKDVVGLISRSRECAPPSWRLRRFTLDVDNARNESAAVYLPLEPLLLSSASTLRVLSLSLCQGSFGDITALPCFVNVSELSLRSHLIKSPDVENFLSHFPSIEDLNLLNAQYLYGSIDIIPLNFAKYAPTTQRLVVQGYRIARLPPSIQTLQVDVLNGVVCAVSQHRSNEVKALRLRMTNASTNILRDEISQLAPSYPSLQSFEIRDHYPAFATGTVGKDNVTEIANIALDVWPLLDTLVMNVRDFRYRPRRRDFPNTNDGMDAEMKQLVLAMFKRHSALNIVALNGIPRIEDNPYIFPRRVWKREGDDAVLVGRDAIRWKFDTTYSRYYTDFD